MQQPQPMSPQHEQFSHVFFDLANSLASSRVSGSLIDFVSGQIHMLMVPEQTKIAPITANGATFGISVLWSAHYFIVGISFLPDYTHRAWQL